MQSARPEPEARYIRNTKNPLPEFYNNLNIRGNIIVQASNEDREENVDEEYYVAKIEQCALKLEKAGVYSSVLFQKNDWIVFVHWCVFVPSTQDETTGDRFYSKGGTQWIPCNSILRCITEPVTLTYSSRHYQLSKSLHNHIERHGDISY